MQEETDGGALGSGFYNSGFRVAGLLTLTYPVFLNYYFGGVPYLSYSTMGPKTAWKLLETLKSHADKNPCGTLGIFLTYGFRLSPKP